MIGKLKNILAVGVLLLLSSCYSEYLHLNYRLFHGACRNDDDSRVAFIASGSAYLPAKGIARFPDGGTSKHLLEKFTLSVFVREDDEVMELIDFEDLSGFLGCNRSNWQPKLAYTDSLIYCSVAPVAGWDWYLKKAETDEAIRRISNLKKKYSQFVFDEKTMTVSQVDSASFNSAYEKRNEIDFTNFNNQLKKVPLAERGFVINDIYPKSNREYIEETIYLKNDSYLARRAVVEQIISKLNKEEIKELLLEMDEYKNSLDGLEKSKYEIYSEETRKIIEALL